jgi:hypothetical protein
MGDEGKAVGSRPSPGGFALTKSAQRGARSCRAKVCSAGAGSGRCRRSETSETKLPARGQARALARIMPDQNCRRSIAQRLAIDCPPFWLPVPRLRPEPAMATGPVTAIRLMAMDMAPVTAIRLTGLTELRITPWSDDISMPPLPVSGITVITTNAGRVRAFAPSAHFCRRSNTASLCHHRGNRCDAFLLRGRR